MNQVYGVLVRNPAAEHLGPTTTPVESHVLPTLPVPFPEHRTAPMVSAATGATLNARLAVCVLNEVEDLGSVARRHRRFDDIVLVAGCFNDDSVATGRGVRADVRCLHRRATSKGGTRPYARGARHTFTACRVFRRRTDPGPTRQSNDPERSDPRHRPGSAVALRGAIAPLA